jgi:hypothetical protein
MKSLLYQGALGIVPDCELTPCRQEVPINLKYEGRIYRFVLRDKILPEDPYLVLTKATAFALQTGEAYNGDAPKRSVRDFLIKESVVI